MIALAFHSVMQHAIAYWPDLPGYVDNQLMHMLHLGDLV